jgi:methylated-DNA-[protein]-cysteine S-methyltransferase
VQRIQKKQEGFVVPIYFYETDMGKIGIAEKDGKITNLYFTADKLPQEIQTCETPILKEAARQLKSYLAGELEEFSLPLAPDGTAFMKRVWTSLCEIPYGETATYKEIAVKIGAPDAARAVGLANNRNPIPIFIPCHRVIGADGSLTGYRGGLGLKKALLDMEKRKKYASFEIHRDGSCDFNGKNGKMINLNFYPRKALGICQSFYLDFQ